MTQQFNELCEESTMSLTTKKTIRYPKQIQLSEEFLSAFKSEVERFNILDESTDPIHNFSAKFLKALQIELVEEMKKKKNPSFEERKKSAEDTSKKFSSAYEEAKAEKKKEKDEKN
jgi:hypothetical protein